MAGNSMILNKIILKNPNNNISLNIVNPKDFQKLQNTSNVSDTGIIKPNNVLNEIKSCNLQEEINKIINTSSSDSSGGGKRELRNNRRKKNELNKMGNKDQNNNLKNNNNKEINKNNGNEEKKGNLSDVNTQKLEEEVKEQIKKYVVEEQNI